jgi:hypothetical protein
VSEDNESHLSTTKLAATDSSFATPNEVRAGLDSNTRCSIEVNWSKSADTRRGSDRREMFTARYRAGNVAWTRLGQPIATNWPIEVRLGRPNTSNYAMLEPKITSSAARRFGNVKLSSWGLLLTSSLPKAVS